MNRPAESVVAWEQVGVRVRGRDVLHGVSFRVAAGERVALIGPSGAGKTTLLRVCHGMLWPTAGSAKVFGAEIGTLGAKALRTLRRRVGSLQQQDQLVPQLRVAHNVLMGRLPTWSTAKALWSLLWPQEVDRARAALERVELGERLWALPDELSGGEQQRVAIARLLLHQPELVLADEPASALDVRLAREVVQRLFELAVGGRSLLVSLHSLGLLDLGFDRVLALRAGRLVFDGAPAGLTTSVLADLYGAEVARFR